MKIFEVANPKDVVAMDVPFLIRALEYAREDAKGDLDLHNAVERMLAAVKGGKPLNMNDYNQVFGAAKEINEGAGLDGILARYPEEVENFKQGGDLDYDLESALWDYYFNRGDIRNYNADAGEWIAQQLASELGLNEQGVAEGWKDEAEDMGNWAEYVRTKLLNTPKEQRWSIAKQLSQIEVKHFGSELVQRENYDTKTGKPVTSEKLFTQIVQDTLKALNIKQVAGYTRLELEPSEMHKPDDHNGRDWVVSTKLGWLVVPNAGQAPSRVKSMLWKAFLAGPEIYPLALEIFEETGDFTEQDYKDCIIKAAEIRNGGSLETQAYQTYAKQSMDEGAELNKFKTKSGKFPEPREPRFKGDQGSKSETLGRDGKIYHWQDPRAKQGVAEGDITQLEKDIAAAPVKPIANMEANEKIAGRHDADDFDAMVNRLKKLAGAGPLKTVYDPQTRRYKNVPVAQQPK